MAHVQKVKAAGVGPMVGHYAREAEKRGYRRDNIDPERTGLNYAVGFGGVSDTDALAARVRERVSEAVRGHEGLTGKSVRKDANVIMDWVVTLPKDCPEELQGRFFEAAVDFIQQRYGRENVPGGFVHLDESRPHVHVPVVPVLDGKLVAAKVVNRADLRSFHGDLGRAVDEALGVHVSVELDESQQGEKQLSHLSHAEYRAARDELTRTMAERDHEVALTEEVKAVTNSAFEVQSAAVRDQMAALDRAREAEERAALAEERAARAEQAAARAQERLEGVQRDLGSAERRLEDLRGRVSAAKRRFDGLVRAFCRRFQPVLYDIPDRLRGLFERYGFQLEVTRAEDYGNRPLSESQARMPSPDELFRSARETAAKEVQGPYEGPRRGGRAR